MATLVGGLGISHTPSMGVEYDKARSSGGEVSNSWSTWFEGTKLLRSALTDLAPDHLVVVYNDHLNYFDLQNLPMLAVGVGDQFGQADEGWGRRQISDLAGDVRWGAHVLEQLVEQDFDPMMCLALEVDHGIYSWFPYLFEDPWPVKITPIALNMVCQPLPRPSRLVRLGQALRTAIDSFPSEERVVVVATGGMSHQISGSRFGIANEELDRTFLDLLPDHLEELATIPTSELMRVGGTEAAELILWYAMRSALSESAEVMCSLQTFPSITGCGALLMREQDDI